MFGCNRKTGRLIPKERLNSQQIRITRVTELMRVQTRSECKLDNLEGLEMAQFILCSTNEKRQQR